MKINYEVSDRFRDIMNDLKTAGKRALKDIPVDLLAIDTTYQTPERTNRDGAIARLARRWDENKLEPITVVPHIEEGKFYVVNGYGRWMASQLQTPKYEYLCANVLLGAMNLPVNERRSFESELFAYQDREVSKLTPVQLHGALVNIGDPAAVCIERLRKKFDFTFIDTKGQRDKGIIGSYPVIYSTAKGKGENCLEYIFSICAKAGFDRKTNGYASHIISALRDAWYYYPSDRESTYQHLSSWLRFYDPTNIVVEARAKYPMLNRRMACSMYIDDEVSQGLLLKQSRIVNGERVIKIS